MNEYNPESVTKALLGLQKYLKQELNIDAELNLTLFFKEKENDINIICGFTSTMNFAEAFENAVMSMKVLIDIEESMNNEQGVKH